MAFKVLGCVSAASLFIFINTSPVLSQDTGEGTPTELGSPPSSDASSPVRLDPISVTATRSPLDAFEYPGMVTVIRPDDIEARQPSTADDILKWVPNVAFTGGPRRTGQMPSIRGFSGPDVVVTLDGARQNFDAGHEGRFFIDPSLLREVEVLRGPASSLYGSGGTGGIIEFRTVRARDLLESGETAGARISAGYQSANRERLGTFTAFGTPTADVDILGSITKRDSGSIRLGGGDELAETDDDIVSGLAKLGLRLAEHHNVEASFQKFSNRAEEPSNPQGSGSGGLVDRDIRADNWRLSYNYNDPSDRLLDLDVTAYYTSTRVAGRRLDDAGSGPAGERLDRDLDTLGLRLDNRSRVTFSDDVDVTFTYGGEVYRDRQEGSAAAGERDGVPDATANFAGTFIQSEFRLREPFGAVPGDILIIPGLRYDHFTASSAVAGGSKDQAVSPRIGVSYLPTDWSLLFASYGHAFRAPTINEMYLDGVHFRIPIGPGITNRFATNPDLKPQRTRTLEFGGGLNFNDVVASGDRLRLKASHFRIVGKDFIDLDVDQPEPFADCNPFIPGACDGTTRAFNVPNATLWGTEVEASYENRRVRVGLGFSTIDGENEDTGEKLGVLTPTQVTVDTALKLPEADSILGWRVLAARKFDKVDDPSERRDSYIVHDVYFSWQPSASQLAGFRLDLGVDNIFDKSYERVFTGAPEPGRNFKALVSYALKW